MPCTGTCQYRWDGTKWSAPINNCVGPCKPCPPTPGVPDPPGPTTVFIACQASTGPQTVTLTLKRGEYLLVSRKKTKTPRKRATTKKAKTPRSRKK
jgi:hypothetical protein